VKNYFDINYFIVFIIPVFPILLISGPFLSDLFCIILGLLFVLRLTQLKKFSEFLYDYKYYIYFFLSYTVYLNLNSLFSFNPSISLISSITFFRIFLFIFALGFFLFYYNKIYKSFYIIFLISIFLLFLDSSIQYFFDLNIFSNKEIHQNRISSFFGEELIMGSYTSRILPIALACSFLTEVKNKNFWNIVMLTISGFLVMFSGERLAGFYYIGICAIYFVLIKKNFLKFLIIIFCSILIIISFKSSVVDRFYKNTISQFNELGSVLSYRHTLHFKTAYDLFLDNKILGNGIKSFRHKCSEKKYAKSIEEKKIRDLKKINKNPDNSNINSQTKYIMEYDNGCNTHPHNIYLEHLAELGLLGFLFLIIIFFYTSIKLIKLSLKCLFIKETNNINIARGLILSGIFLQLFPFVPSGSYFNNWMMIIFHLSIGFYISTLKLR